eukprot:1525958-Amphidinium_carterae.2
MESCRPVLSVVEVEVDVVESESSVVKLGVGKTESAVASRSVDARMSCLVRCEWKSVSGPS